MLLPLPVYLHRAQCTCLSFSRFFLSSAVLISHSGLKEASHSSNKNTTNTTAPHQAWNPEQSEDQTTINYRLPNTLVPIHYNIQLKPNIYQDDPADFGLEGFSEVILKCAIPTDLVVIHLLDLLIKHIEIESEPPSIFIVNKTEDKATQFLNISLSRALRVGERVKLGFAYKGNLENKIHGLHYRSYKENNQTRYKLIYDLMPHTRVLVVAKSLCCLSI